MLANNASVRLPGPKKDNMYHWIRTLRHNPKNASPPKIIVSGYPLKNDELIK